MCIIASFVRVNQVTSFKTIMDLLETLFFLFLLIATLFCHQESEKTVEDFVKIVYAPKVLQNNCPLNIEYFCGEPSFIKIHIVVSSEIRSNVSVFRHIIRCSPSYNAKKKTIQMKLPRYVAYRPNNFNKYSVHINDTAFIQVWLVPEQKKWWSFQYGNAREDMSVAVEEAHMRPQPPLTRCYDWWMDVRHTLPYAPKCSVEDEVASVLSYPMALNGQPVGLVKQFLPYKNKLLNEKRKREVSTPRFSFVAWMYIVDYCPDSILCSLIHHATWDERHLTPLILLNRRGQIHLEMLNRSGDAIAYMTSNDFVIPLNIWIQLIISYNPSTHWSISMLYGDTLKETFIVLPSNVFIMEDDTKGIYYFGGSDLHRSFRGYYGDIKFYRRRAVSTDQVPKPPADHQMFRLKLSEREKRCRWYMNQVSMFKTQAQELYKYLMHYKQCPNLWTEFKKKYMLKPMKMMECSLLDAPPPPDSYKFMRGMVRNWVFTKRWNDYKKMAAKLVEEVYNILESSGLTKIKTIISLLKQSSCYGNDDATFLLATMLNHGLKIETDEIQSHSYLLSGSMRSNRLSLLSLANKHVFNLDGVPQDLDQAYVYYMSVAYITKMDLNTHRDDGTLTEFIRLTDEKSVNLQTDEDEDLFQWLKYQASQGMHSAQTSIARMLYWGSQGVQRNLTVASTYYKEATSSGNAASLYDYGILLLRGHGVPKNVTQAVEYFERAAAQNHSQAINTLGYHQLVYKRNYTAAAAYFERAFELGNADAGHNLAHMLLSGIYPELNRVERILAWDFLSKAALRGNYDSGLLVAKYNMIGHPRTIRTPSLSVEWARYLAEQNPSVGKLLKKGVKAFRKQNWPAALVYYLMAASSGVEVANFNLAFLCEENYEYLTSTMHKECVWRHYNLSSIRSNNRDNPYAWLKMADYHYTHKDMNTAARNYMDSAVHGDPQALFNLGLMVEDGVKIEDDLWNKLQIPFVVTRNKELLLNHIYEKCKDSKDSDAYLPCLLASSRVRVQYVWKRHALKIMSILVATLVLVTFLLTSRLIHKFTNRRRELMDAI